MITKEGWNNIQIGDLILTRNTTRQVVDAYSERGMNVITLYKPNSDTEKITYKYWDLHRKIIGVIKVKL